MVHYEKVTGMISPTPVLQVKGASYRRIRFQVCFIWTKFISLLEIIKCFLGYYC